MIIASLSSLIASMNSEGTSSLTTSSLGRLMAGGVAGELVIGSDSIAGLALLTVGAEGISEAVKSGEGSTPL